MGPAEDRPDAETGGKGKYPIGEADMDRTRIDEIASTLDDIATTLDEIKEEHCSASSETLDRMRRSVERATDAIDRLENSGSIPIVRRHEPADE